MTFFGKAFTFDGVPSEQFDLMLYDIGSESAEEAEFAGIPDVVEDVVSKRWKPYFYGVKHDEKLSFEMTFGVNQRRIDAEKYLDRYELAEIAAWLTGHDNYKDLEIEQDDMSLVRYKCMVSKLSRVSFGSIPWALRATITCDGPYAYLEPAEERYTVNGTASVSYYNRSSLNTYYMPKIEFDISSGSGFSIENMADNGRTLTFSGIPGSISKVYVDNDKGIVTNDQDLNIYDQCNYNWLRTKRGLNTLNVTGNGTLIIRSEFPVDVGG